jgi:hypothetical protein
MYVGATKEWAMDIDGGPLKAVSSSQHLLEAGCLFADAHHARPETWGREAFILQRDPVRGGADGGGLRTQGFILRRRLH